jgi:hypothetical protein
MLDTLERGDAESRTRERHAAEDAEMDQIAASTVAAILHQVEMTLSDSSETFLEAHGHYMRVGLTGNGKERLRKAFESMIRGQLAGQRSAGEIASFRENGLLGRML